MTQKSQPSGTVGERIRGLLSERRMSQRQLAAALAGDGAPTNSVENMRRQISSWVNDQHVPSPENAEALAEHLRVPVEWLTGAPPRRSMSAALEELAQVVEQLSEEAERSQDASRIVQGLDRRLADIEALLGRLLQGQTTASAALGEILDRWNEAAESRSDPQRGEK